MNSYYIEIRYFGKAKYKFKRLVNQVDNKFNLKRGHKVPHITVIQPFKTNNERKLVGTFKRICSNHKRLITFKVDGIGIFPFFVVFAKVHPSQQLIQLRKDFMYSLKKFCKIADFNRAYKPHTTIALRMGIIKFFRIWLYLKFKPRIVFTNHVMRLTLLKGKKILYEYDFTKQKLLNRNQAKSRKNLAKTFKNLKLNKRK